MNRETMDSCAVGKEGQFRRQMNSLLVQRFTKENFAVEIELRYQSEFKFLFQI
jgi:hypothetical protein